MKKILFLAYVTPGVFKGSLEKCSLFGLAVWLAIADIFINKYVYIYERRASLYSYTVSVILSFKCRLLPGRTGCSIC